MAPSTSWSGRFTQGHREFPFWKRKIPPPPKKKFPFGKMLDFARSNTISTQTSNIYLNQLQWYGQFGEVYMLLEVLSLEIYPNVSVTNSFPSVPCRDWPAAIDHRSVVSTIAPPSGQTVRRPPDTGYPLRTSSLEHLASHADECKSLAYDLLELSERPHSCNDLSLRNSDAVRWFFDINSCKYTGTL